MMTIKHLSLFSGIESFKKALTNLGIENELVGYSEIDKYASVALSAIHGVSEELNYGDITKIDETKVPDCDLITYGFPCQDISVAGLGKGIVEDETRSGLLYDALRIIKYKKPKYAIAENVKNLVGKKFKEDFEGLLAELESYGYNNYWQVLNAKNYGIPQNRERVFVVSIRKDVDDGKFEFPKPFDNGKRLKDILEKEVDEKYYLNGSKAMLLIQKLKDDGQLNNPIETVDGGINKPKAKDISNCIKARYDCGISNQRSDGTMVVESNTITTVQKDNLVLERTNELQFVGGIGDKDWAGDNKQFSRNYPQGNRVYSSEGIACSQTANGGGLGGATGLYLDNELKLFTNLEGGKWDKIHESARRVYDEEGIAPTIPTCGGGNIEPKVHTNYKIRKLTPKECWRLMGFTDEDYFKARQALEDRFYNGRDRSNSQMYKMAGNSIVVDVLEAIFKELFI